MIFAIVSKHNASKHNGCANSQKTCVVHFKQIIICRKKNYSRTIIRGAPKKNY